jgi:pectate lyase
VSAAVVAAGVGAGVLVMNANADPVDLYHQTLPAKDGWAASGTGTTGGAKADSAHTFTVATRAQLVKALGPASDTTPRIVRVKGRTGPRQERRDVLRPPVPDPRRRPRHHQRLDPVTVERNQFTDHDKTMPIGGSDTDSTGKLRVSVHHNVWKGIVQRAPLARIHGYDNVHNTTTVDGYAPLYSINSRAKAQVVAENNFWKVPSGGKVAKLLSGDGTGSIAGSGNLVNGTATDLVAVYDAANSKKIRTTVNWTPTLTAGLESSAKNLPAELATTTGAGVLK